MLSGWGRRGKRRNQTSGLVRRCTGPPSDGEAPTSDDGGTPGDGAGPPGGTPGDDACTLGDDAVTPGDGVGTPGDDGGPPVLEDDARGALVSWAFRPPALLRSGRESGVSRSSNRSRNNPRRKPAGSSIR